jgi:hypothetical protein
LGSDTIDDAIVWGEDFLFFRKGVALVYSRSDDKVRGVAGPIAAFFGGGTGALLFEDKVKDNREAFVAKVRTICQALQIDPNWLMALMHHESGLDPKIRNKQGAVGLIQMMPGTAAHHGTTPDALAAMSNVEQLDYALKYYKSGAGRFKSFTDLYLYGFYPIVLGKSDDWVIGSEGGEKKIAQVVRDNKPLDGNKDGEITIGEFRAWARTGFSAETLAALGE